MSNNVLSIQYPSNETTQNTDEKRKLLSFGVLLSVLNEIRQVMSEAVLVQTDNISLMLKCKDSIQKIMMYNIDDMVNSLLEIRVLSKAAQTLGIVAIVVGVGSLITGFALPQATVVLATVEAISCGTQAAVSFTLEKAQKNLAAAQYEATANGLIADYLTGMNNMTSGHASENLDQKGEVSKLFNDMLYSFYHSMTQLNRHMESLAKSKS